MVKNASKQGFSLAQWVIPNDTPLKFLFEEGGSSFGMDKEQSSATAGKARVANCKSKDYIEFAT